MERIGAAYVFAMSHYIYIYVEREREREGGREGTSKNERR